MCSITTTHPWPQSLREPMLSYVLTSPKLLAMVAFAVINPSAAFAVVYAGVFFGCKTVAALAACTILRA